VSIPPFLHLPNGVISRSVSTPRGEFATLDNEAAVRPAAGQLAGTALFIPGFTGSKEDFIAIVGPLAAAGMRAVAIDLRGQYESKGPVKQEGYSLAGFAADVLGVIRDLPGPIHVVGHSMGGLVAREAVLADPLAIDSLVLMSSGPGAIPKTHRARMQLFAQVLAQAGLEFVWAAKQALEEEEGSGGPSDAAIAEFVTQRFLASAPGSLLEMVEVLCNEPDRTGELATVAPPTLVLFGDRDDVWSPDEQRRMSDALESLRTELPGVGHSPAAEAPAETVAALLEFWDEILTTPSR
jgi:pimeloyl-ACP methyl ester carboxylesterase